MDGFDVTHLEAKDGRLHEAESDPEECIGTRLKAEAPLSKIRDPQDHFSWWQPTEPTIPPRLLSKPQSPHSVG